MAGMFTGFLDDLDPDRIPVTYPSTVSSRDALLAARSAPSNNEVLQACKDAYHQHEQAVDDTTTGSVNTALDRTNSQDIAACQAYDWHSQVAAPQLTRPLLHSADMTQALRSVEEDGDFATIFLGVEANLDVFVGGFGGVGVGFGLPSGSALWMAWGGLRISLNIDIAINLTTGIFLEPPDKVAGEFIGIEISCEPIAEGPSIGFGIHLSPDLSTIRGFTMSVGAELGILPGNVAIEHGSIVTT